MPFEPVFRFVTHPRPFWVEDEYCFNSECNCVHLTFREIDERREKRKPIVFRVSIDLDTRREVGKPERPAIVDDWVAEFLHDCPPEKFEEYRHHRKREMELDRLVERHTFSAEQMFDGMLISYPDMLAQIQGKAGGVHYTYAFHYRGRSYIIRDLYCPRPHCDCRAVTLAFDEVPRKRSGENGEEKRSCGKHFAARVHLSGAINVVTTAGCPREEAEEALAAWWKNNRHLLSVLKKRDLEMKRIGRRSLAAHAKAARRADKSTPRPAAETVPAGPPELKRPSPLKKAAKPGRNEPCSCGSGKKYKKCCGRKAALVS